MRYEGEKGGERALVLKRYYTEGVDNEGNRWLLIISYCIGTLTLPLTKNIFKYSLEERQWHCAGSSEFMILPIHIM